MEYVYPAIFHKNSDESYTITYPDLPGCISEGKSLGNAMYMAESALTQWMGYLTEKKQEIPHASSPNEPPQGKPCGIFSVWLYHHGGSFDRKFIIPSGLLPNFACCSW
jgi:predicted RNase H-like HicB family nuclease